MQKGRKVLVRHDPLSKIVTWYIVNPYLNLTSYILKLVVFLFCSSSNVETRKISLCNGLKVERFRK